MNHHAWVPPLKGSAEASKDWNDAGIKMRWIWAVILSVGTILATPLPLETSALPHHEAWSRGLVDYVNAWSANYGARHGHDTESDGST
jgi:hypothetical protein